jgi:hypothetical protein
LLPRIAQARALDLDRRARRRRAAVAPEDHHRRPGIDVRQLARRERAALQLELLDDDEA